MNIHPNPQEDRAAKGCLKMILLIALLFALRVALKAQCPTLELLQNPLSEIMEVEHYHCYKVVTDTTIYNWNINQDSTVNVPDLLEMLSVYGGQISANDLLSFLTQYGTAVNVINAPELCYIDVNTIQSSGATLFVPEEYEQFIFSERPDITFPNITDDFILGYTQADETEEWPTCLQNQILCLQTFKLIVFVGNGGPFADVEEYYFLKR